MVNFVFSVTQLLFSAALIYVARQSWKATDRYSRITALEALLKNLEVVMTQRDHAGRRYAQEACVVILSDFPDYYGRLEANLPPSVKAKMALAESHTGKPA